VGRVFFIELFVVYLIQKNYIQIMNIIKLLSCLYFIALLGCASSEPVKQKDSNADDVRARAQKAYSELDAGQ
jgi:hypothetical protein